MLDFSLDLTVCLVSIQDVFGFNRLFDKSSILHIFSRQLYLQHDVNHRVVKLLLCAYYYYYYYYFTYLNSLLLLLLRHIFKQPITITISITRNIKEAYYYYFSDYYYYYYYYFPTNITFIITVNPKNHSTSRLQSNIQRHVLIPLYHTLPQTHYHR